MTIVVGLTGGIASGKTTITKQIRFKKIPVHDSDSVVRGLYKNASNSFIKHLKKIGLKKAIKNNKILKKTVRAEVLKNKPKLKALEEYIHNKTRISRNRFIYKNKKLKQKIIVLDIPLLFEKKLNKCCDYVLLVYCPKRIRIKRALKRKNTNKKIIESLINLQLSDSYKIKKSDFIINTSKSKEYSVLQITNALKKIILYERSNKRNNSRHRNNRP